MQQEFTVHIYPVKAGYFLTTFIHPLTKSKVREHFKTKEEAKAYKEQIEHKFKRRRVENYRELNLEELLALYIQEKPKSEFNRSKRIHMSDFFATFGGLKLDEISTDNLKAWLEQIRMENNLQEISLRGIKCELDRFFKWLVEKEVISESPLTAIFYKKHVPSLKTRTLLSEEEIAKLLSTIKAYSPGYLYPLIKFFAETAAKTTEVLDLTWDDLRLDTGMVKLKRTKTSQERALKLSDELMDIFRKKKDKKGLLFATYYGEAFTKNKIRRVTDEFKSKKLYDGDWNQMDLRHSFAVNFLSKGGNIRDLQYILGHDNVFQTKQLYGEAVTKKLRQNFVNPLDLQSETSS